MSNYRALTEHPILDRYEWAEWIDDCFGPHKYGVKFDCEDGVFDPKTRSLKVLEPGDKGYYPDVNPFGARSRGVMDVTEARRVADDEIERFSKAGVGHDSVKFPPHYQLPNGIECKEVSKYFTSFKGQALQYIWRAGKKEGNTEEQDLRKAIECLEIELTKLIDCVGVDEGESGLTPSNVPEEQEEPMKAFTSDAVTIKKGDLPEGVEFVSLNSLPFLEKGALPESVKRVSLDSATSLEKGALPNGVEIVYLDSLPEARKEALRKELPQANIY